MDSLKLSVVYTRWVLHWTYQEIGDFFGFSRQRAHQIVKEGEDAINKQRPGILNMRPTPPVP